MRHGTVMSLRGTALGRLFAAHRPRAETLPLLRAENRKLGHTPGQMRAGKGGLDEELAAARWRTRWAEAAGGLSQRLGWRATPARR